MNAEKAIDEMNVQEVFKFIEEHFNTEAAEKFEAQNVDGKTLVLLSKRASQEQYEACGLLTVADQLKLSSLVNSSAEASVSTGFEVKTIKPKKPSKAQLLQISETAQRIYKTKRKAIRNATIKRWPGNDIPNFKKSKVAVDELNTLVNDLKEDCSFPPLNFGEKGIRQHILDVLNERRRNKRKGRDYSQPDKRTLKRKVDVTGDQEASSDSTLSTDIDDSSACGSSADNDEEIGDSEDTNKSGDTESVEAESDENEDLDEDTAKLVVCVAYNAIQISDVTRNQLQSSVKALKITTKKKDKNDLVKLVAEALVEKGFVKVKCGHSKKVSRDDIKKVKAF